MKPPALLICLLGAVLPCSLCASAQQEQSLPLPPMQSLPVYVVDFQQSEPIREIGDLGTFTTSLVDLRLLEIPSVTVRRVPKAPPCGNAQPRDITAQVQGGPPASTVAPSGDFYVVHGSIEVRLPDIVLDYSVDKCEGQSSQTVLQDTQPFTLDHAREELTIAAHAIGYKIEHITPPTQVTVEMFQIEGDVQDPKSVQETMRSQVIQAMSRTPDIAVSDASDYRVKGKITFQKGAALLRVVPLAKTTLQADLRVEAHGKPYPMRPLASSRADLEKFSADVAEEVRRILPQVLLAEHLNLPQVLGNMKLDELLTRGSQLLDQCPPREHDCSNAQYAIPLLSSTTLQDSKSWRAFWLLGRAQMLAGKYADATGSLKTSTEIIKQEINLGKLIPPRRPGASFQLVGRCLPECGEICSGRSRLRCLAADRALATGTLSQQGAGPALRWQTTGVTADFARRLSGR